VAGFIDGDGCFLISKKGYCSLEITTHVKDHFLLVYIQNKYGGSLKPRAGLNCVRYRLIKKDRLKTLCIDVNGYLRHPIRLQQFEKV